MLVPLYGFLRGDTIGLVVLVQDTDLISAVAASLQQAASVRVAPRPGASVYWRGERLDPALTVGETGLSALDRIDVVPEERV